MCNSLYCLRFAAACLGLLWSLQGTAGELPSAAAADSELPQLLSDTGLYERGTRSVAHEMLRYSPQYPLWSDAAQKRRWMYLPPGTSIDASDPDRWEFPPGTRFWKEFGYTEPVETRFIERLADGSWRYATYVWNEEKTEAFLASELGIARHPVAAAAGGYYPIPTRDDCRACHEGGAVPVLGVGTLQLSAQRDPLAPNAERWQPGYVTLEELVTRKLVRNLPAEHAVTPAEIPASSPTARAALGYLHANCGHCHNPSGPLADLELNLLQSVVASARQDETAAGLEMPSEFHLYGATQRIVPGQPARSVLALRMQSRHPVAQMPPLGTRMVDTNATLLIERWIQEIPVSVKE